MTKKELIDTIAEKLSMTKKSVARVVDEVVTQIQDALANGEKCVLVGFGKFEVVDRAAREGINPSNPSEKIHIPAKKVPVFRAGKELKDSVSG